MSSRKCIHVQFAIFTQQTCTRAHINTHTDTCALPNSDDFHIDLRNDSTFDQSSGSSGTMGQILITAKSILPPPEGVKGDGVSLSCLAI